MQGIRNDDQSLSPVTPLVSLFFLSFLGFFKYHNMTDNYAYSVEMFMKYVNYQFI